MTVGKFLALAATVPFLVLMVFSVVLQAAATLLGYALVLALVFALFVGSVVWFIKIFNFKERM